jgi:hypothetical protein
LEDSSTTHQGVKLAKVMYGFEPTEEAFKNIRDNYKSKKQD